VRLAQHAHDVTYAPERVLSSGKRHTTRRCQGEGVRAVGVASGRSTADELRAAGAGTVLASLDDTDALAQLQAVGRDRPALGSCVGMQVLFAHGRGHGVETGAAANGRGTVERCAIALLRPDRQLGPVAGFGDHRQGAGALVGV
jgi:phosphoribosylformylglycinamidine (FGAM) synthase-like amidotransferase family enzyme